MPNDHILLRKLDRFIRKYYKNQLIRGGLFLITFLGAAYLLLIGLELLFHFNQLIRGILFFSYLISSLFFFTLFILVPAFRLLKIGKIISYEQAATIIGSHFIEIQDKLLNTLQLINLQKETSTPTDLLVAGIDQKIEALKVFSFTSVINIKKNLHYLRYLLIPIVVLILLSFFSPHSISDPTQRIIRFNQHFEKPLPFQIVILNKNLIAMQQEDFELDLKITGDEIPAEVFLQTGGVSYKMQKNKGFHYSFLFRSLQSDISFKISAENYTSDLLILKVYPKPIILNFEINISYPSYTHKSKEIIENTGDLIVPEGSTIEWNFYTKDVKEINLHFLKRKINLRKTAGNKFSYSGIFMESTQYSVIPVNPYIYKADSLVYSLTVLADAFPSIFVTEAVDSTLNSILFFNGTIKDDYGFSKLLFNYKIISNEDSIKNKFKISYIPIENAINNQNFYYSLNLDTIRLKPGQQIEYFFEVFDNDGINGPKSNKSEIRKMSVPTLKEIENQTLSNEKKAENDLGKSIDDTKNIKKTMEELNRKMVEQNTISWQDKKKIESLIQENEQISRRIEQIKNMNLNNIENEKKYLETNERIIEKQRELNNLLDKTLSEEMKKLMQEMKDLLNQLDKNKLGELLEKLKFSNRDLENQLDRNLELFKQIEFDRKLDALVNEVKRNAEMQEKLASETNEMKKPSEYLIKEQKEINKKADSINQSLDQLTKDSEKIETKPDLSHASKIADSISKTLKNVDNQLHGKTPKNASKDQKKAAQQMKELAQNMEDAKDEEENDQLQEDASYVRMILENLVRLSFEQEDLISNTRKIVRNDPRYSEIMSKQKEMKDKLKGVEDSLKAIARRQILIQPIIVRETSRINQNIEDALKDMESRNISKTLINQQMAMTAINNLALLLNESLEKMNEQMNMNMKSKGGQKTCQKPSKQGGKASLKNMKEVQEKISKQLEDVKQSIERMKNEKNGMKGGKSALNEQVAKLAAAQEALRNELQQYQRNLEDQGIKDNGTIKQTIKDMENNETDLLYKQISQESIFRQQKILSRMLVSEKAEQLRDREEQRQSTEAKNQIFSNPLFDFKYKANSRKDRELLYLTLPSLTPFYRNKVSSYIVKIEQNEK